MPTCKCGKTVDDMRGARGHVQFTAGDGHGEKQEVPEGWRDLFEATDDEVEEAVEQAEAEADDEGGQQDAGEAAADPDDREDSAEKESTGGRLTAYLTTPLDELLGGRS